MSDPTLNTMLDQRVRERISTILLAAGIALTCLFVGTLLGLSIADVQPKAPPLPVAVCTEAP